MKLNSMPKLMMDGLESKLPIIQGGMSVGISMSGLASAVANAGGIGTIGAAGLGLLNPTLPNSYKENNEIALRHEIRKAKRKTEGPIAVNIMMALSDYDNLIMAAVDEKVDAILIGAGTFLKAPPTIDMDKVKDSVTRILPIVSSQRAANVIFKFWGRHYGFVPDGIIVEGPLAGGHLGFAKDDLEKPEHSLDAVLPQVIDTIRPYREQFKMDIPVIAAGGIFSGADIYKYLQMGASGVQMGTRFVATHECDASLNFKMAYLACEKDDITIIDSPVGMPGRAIKNKFIEDVRSGVKQPFACPWKCLRTCDFKQSSYCIAKALTSAQRGKLSEGFTFAGQNVYRIRRMTSVNELMNSLVEEYELAANKAVSALDGITQVEPVP